MHRPGSLLSFAWVAFFVAPVLAADTFTVTTNADDGPGSLRQAILEANAHGGADSIAFAIPGGGVQTIAIATSLPIVTDALTIDGYTQPGASPNTNDTSKGLNTILTVEVHGAIDDMVGGACFRLRADDVTLRGLVINGCADTIVVLDADKSNNVLAGNFIGTDPLGATAVLGTFLGGSTSTGVYVKQSGARIGGTAPADRNLISGAFFEQVHAESAPDLLVQGNLISTDATGRVPIGGGPSNGGIGINGGSAITIGGTSAAARNVFAAVGEAEVFVTSDSVTDVAVLGNSFGVDPGGTAPVAAETSSTAISFSRGGPGFRIEGNTIGNFRMAGIALDGVDDVGIRGNFIGTDPTETFRFGNGGGGLSVTEATNVVVGSATDPAEANAIAFNGAFGVAVVEGGTATVRGNRIYGNAPGTSGQGLAIDLAPDFQTFGVTPNDAGDADTGPNGLQNFPIVTAVTLDPGSTTVDGVLDSTASATFDLDFYADAPCGSEHGAIPEAEKYLGTAPVTTDASGHVAFHAVLPVGVEPGSRVTASATSSGGDTSELFPGIVQSIAPGSGPAAGGTALTVHGMLFESGAALTVGGAAAGGVAVPDADTVTGEAPALAPGTLNAVAVSNPGGLAGSLPEAWVADFLDVPEAHLFHAPVVRLFRNGVTKGCGGGNFCPEAAITRAEMAIFLVRGKFGACFVPPPATGTVFSDVPADAFGSRQIELLASLGVTGGCGGGKFCPNAIVTRDTMAVLLLRAILGSGFQPPPPHGVFDDVPVSHPFAKWIEELARRNITGGCGGNNYCPGNPNTRGEMAAFVARTFGLP